MPSFGATYYVSNGGSDAASGLVGFPWLTVAKLNSTAFVSGDIILFDKADVFSDATLTLGALVSGTITLGAYGTGADPILGNDVRQPFYINESGANIVMSDLHIKGSAWTTGLGGSRSYIFNAADVTITDCEFEGTAGGATSKTGLEIDSATGAVKIIDSSFHGYGWPVTYGNGDIMGAVIDLAAGGTVDVWGSSFYQNDADGLQLFRGTSTVDVNTCLFWDNGEEGLDIKGSSNVTVYDNDFWRSSTFDDLGGGGNISAMHLIAVDQANGYAANNVTIYDCNIGPFPPNADLSAYQGGSLDDEGWGIFTFGSGLQPIENLVVRNNTFLGGTKTDYGIRVDDKVIGMGFYNNILLNCSIYESTSGATPNNYYNNTIYNGHINILWNVGTVVRNNSVHTVDTLLYPLTWTGSGPTAPVFTYNTGYSGSSIKRATWAGTEYDSTEESDWIAAGHTGAVFTDPMYKGVPDDVNLVDTSPNIDAGVDTSLTTDYYGNSRVSSYDIGAIEYQTAGVPSINVTPTPADSAAGVSTTTTLVWVAGSGATSHDIFFGTDSTPDETEYVATQAGVTYDQGTMLAGTTYYWRIDSVNSSGTTAGTTWSFTTTGSQVSGWFDTAYLYRKKITIDSTNVGSNLTGFPLQVEFTNDADVGVHARADGDDIRFTSDDGTTEIPYEEELWDVTASEADLVAWVKCDPNAATPAWIYMYYGNSGAADGQDAANVYDSSFIGVWHMAAVTDSTGDTSDLTFAGDLPDVAAGGYIGLGQDFDGTGDYADIGTVTDISDAGTVTLWVKAVNSDAEQVIAEFSTHSTRRHQIGIEDSDNMFQGATYNGTTYQASTAFSTAWTYVAWTILTDTTLTTSFNLVAGTDSGNDMILGAANNASLGYSVASSNDPFTGIIDEVQISSVVRSADWIAFAYYNASESDNELTFAAEEDVPSQSAQPDNLPGRSLFDSTYRLRRPRY